MKCDWIFHSDRGGRASYECTVCRVMVVNNTGLDDASFLESRPDCGVTMAALRAKAPSQRNHRSPGVGEKVKRYATAVARWIAAGRPTREAAEVERIYETLCRPCEEFNHRGSCGICGCKVRSRGKALFNKIGMATESCPKGKW